MVLLENSTKLEEEKRSAELRRGAQQIFRSDGYIDMRSVMAVRRATQATIPSVVLMPEGNIPGVNETPDHHTHLEEASTSDGEDAGGDGALNSSKDKQGLRLKRSFELVLRTGHVIRLEVSLVLPAQHQALL